MRTLRRRPIEAWGQCRHCADTFNLTFWVRIGRDGVLYGRIEPTTDVQIVDNEIHHRCGGTVKIYGLPDRLVLVDR